MSDFINKLIQDNKLQISTDMDKSFGFKVGNKQLGEEPVLIAGPCSIESEDMIVDWSCKLSEVGIDALRAGAYKPCTFPVRKEVNGWKEGLKESGLKFLKTASDKSGLQTVSEIMDLRMLTNEYLDKLDIIQVGTRNFQNYTLLDELGKIDKPIILKRGTWGTLDEILGACERILEGGNNKLAICLRGVIGGPSYRHIFPSTRWMPDLLMIPALKKFTNIPIIYDPSHATGLREFVVPVSKAALAIGADGLIVEVHPDPSKSISDPDQAIGLSELIEIKSFYQ
jgi:3-deoxy-7-phosphoheptulonate synthase|tara:strand:+ start:2812 stop:3660 length:849 start_codon:yes stop_codon:yes gene_type:complete